MRKSYVPSVSPPLPWATTHQTQQKYEWTVKGRVCVCVMCDVSRVTESLKDESEGRQTDRRVESRVNGKKGGWMDGWMHFRTVTAHQTPTQRVGNLAPTHPARPPQSTHPPLVVGGCEGHHTFTK